MSPFIQKYLIAVLAVLGALILSSLIHAVVKKRFSEKIVATNLLSSQALNVIVVLAVLLGTDYILDVGLVFALLSFLMVIVLCRFLQRRADSGAEREQNGEVPK